MLDRIFPKRADNDYRGPRPAIWLFGLVVLMELAMGTNSIINTRLVVMSADGIPLDQYGEGAADAVIALFAIAGLFRVLLALQGIVILVRYRSAMPFMYLVLLILHVGSKLLLFIHPVTRSKVATAQLGSAFVLAIIAMLFVGFVLSMHRSKSASAVSRDDASKVS